jgi:hypothetical protein
MLRSKQNKSAGVAATAPSVKAGLLQQETRETIARSAAQIMGPEI